MNSKFLGKIQSKKRQSKITRELLGQQQRLREWLRGYRIPKVPGCNHVSTPTSHKRDVATQTCSASQNHNDDSEVIIIDAFMPPQLRDDCVFQYLETEGDYDYDSEDDSEQENQNGDTDVVFLYEKF